ncbi:ATP-binding protein [Desulfosarcina sp. OttesenSCG-928-B08]|nr:ATP-binding protein [Desulfosarcina sp. OttesenSCG-928-B08]
MPANTLCIAARIDQLAQAIAFVQHGADHAGLSPDKKFGVTLAVEEAFVNICRHAYPDCQGDVVLAFRLDADRFVVELSDTGIVFDMLSIEDPDLDAGVMERKVGGLGIYFIRTLANGVSYQRQGDRNVLQMKFTIPPSPVPDNA